MIDTEGFDEMVLRERCLYHLVWDATPEKISSVLEHGLERVKSNYRGFWESRDGHVYLGRMSILKKIFFKVDPAKAFVPDAGTADYAIFSVDLRRLEPKKVNPNEDHFGLYTSKDGLEISRRFGLPFSPSKWTWDWAQYLGITPPPSLGEWAHQIGLGSDPETTRYSVQQGSIAYGGVVPPSALQLKKTSLQLEEEARMVACV